MPNVIKLPTPAPATKRQTTIAQAAAAKDKPDAVYEVRATKPLGLLLRVAPTGRRVYYVQVGRGKRIRIGEAGAYTLAQAREEAGKILRDPAAAMKPKADGITLADYIKDSYADHAKAMLKNGEKSVARVKAIWKTLLNKRLIDITATEVAKLRVKRINAGVAPATVNRDVAALSGVFAHWVKHGGGKHPLADVAPLKVANDETVRYLTPDESRRLRQALADRDAAAAQARRNANEWRAEREYELLPEITGFSDHLTPMVLLGLNTGLRQGELFALTWENVDLQRKTITVLASHSKGNATRHVPLNAEALSVLTTIKPEVTTGLVFKSPKTGGEFDNVKKAWSLITQAAKLPDLRWHDLRHDFASQLVMKGVPLFTVQKLLGHANSKMTQRYAKLAPSTLADAVEMLGNK